MARFYNTAKPQFIDDIMYQPPWQLAQAVLANKQAGYENAMQSTSVIDDMLDIKHLDFEDENAKGIKEYYNSEIDSLTNQLRENPNEYSKIMPKIKALSRQINSDRKEGNIADVERRYTAFSEWQKENADLAKSEPDTYNRLANHWYEDIKGRTATDKTSKFAGVRGLSRPKLEWEKVMGDIKANTVRGTDGKYYYENEEVTEQRVQEIAWNKLKSDPNFAGYLNQMGNTLGMEQYKTSPFELRNDKGEVVTYEQYEKLDDEAKKKVNRYVNPEGAFASDISMASGISAYSKTGVNKATEYGVIGAKAQVDAALQQQKAANDLNRLITGKKMDFDKMIKEYELKGGLAKLKAELEAAADAEGGAGPATDKLDELNAKATFGTVGSNKTSYEKNTQAMLAGDKDAVQNEQNARGEARGALGYQSGTKEHQFLQHIDAKVQDGVLDGDKIATEFAKIELEDLKAELEGYARNTDNPSAYKSRKAQYETSLKHAKDKYKKVYDQYKNAKSDYFKENHQTHVTLEPVTAETNQALTATINTNKGSYYTTDAEGNKVMGGGEEGLKTVKTVDRVFGANPKERLGMHVTFDDGTKGYVFPNQSKNQGAQVNTVKNLVLDGGLVNKSSALYKELTNAQLEDLQNRFSQTKPSKEDGITRLLYEFQGEKIPIHKVGNTYYVVDPNNPKAKGTGYDDLAKIVEKLYKD